MSPNPARRRVQPHVLADRALRVGAVRLAEHSVGVLGRTERLPTRQVLELTTLCGHGMVSHNHARKMIDWARPGKVTPRRGAEHLARPCICGAFNIARAEESLARAVGMA